MASTSVSTSLSGEKMSTDTVYVVDAVRIPIGKIGGGLAHIRPDDLAAGTISSLVNEFSTWCAASWAGLISESQKCPLSGSRRLSSC